MTADSNFPSHDELEALIDSGFALAVQLLRHHEDAADVVQDALRKLIHSGQYDRRKGNPHVWFLKVVRNGALDALRQRRPNDDDAVANLAATAPPPDIAVDPPILSVFSRISGRWPASATASAATIDPPPDIAVEREELAGIVRRQLESMPVAQREIILLRDFHDLSYAEVAEVLGIANGTVMSRLHRARYELRNRMKKYLQ